MKFTIIIKDVDPVVLDILRGKYSNGAARNKRMIDKFGIEGYAKYQGMANNLHRYMIYATYIIPTDKDLVMLCNDTLCSYLKAKKFKVDKPQSILVKRGWEEIKEEEL